MLNDVMPLSCSRRPSQVSAPASCKCKSGSKAVALLEAAKSDKKSGRQRIDYIMLAVHGKKVGIEKVLTMMDNMVDLLKAEQKADNVSAAE